MGPSDPNPNPGDDGPQLDASTVGELALLVVLVVLGLGGLIALLVWAGVVQ